MLEVSSDAVVTEIRVSLPGFELLKMATDMSESHGTEAGIELSEFATSVMPVQTFALESCCLCS